MGGGPHATFAAPLMFLAKQNLFKDRATIDGLHWLMSRTRWSALSRTVKVVKGWFEGAVCASKTVPVVVETSVAVGIIVVEAV